MIHRIRLAQMPIAVIFICATLAGACYVPYSVHVKVPDGAETVLPPQLELEDERFLAIPVWWSSETSNFLGSPVLLESEELSRLGEMTSSYRKRGMVDIFGHEGSGIPIFKELYLLSESGIALRAKFDIWAHMGPKGWAQHESGWTEVYFAPVTDTLRNHLVDAATEETISEPFGSVGHEFWRPPALFAYYEEKGMPMPPFEVGIPWTEGQRAAARVFLDAMATRNRSDAYLWELAMDLNPQRHQRELL
ncbi:MAG: hypothetical protein GY719_04355 [bacterium]|nr:hypothetical protein [bacterium]